MSRPEVTVVVPTRDRPEALSRCVAALARQSLGDAMETIIVDDGSRRPDAVEEAARLLPGARVLRGGGAGPAAARNAGARQARAPVVCFTDDDCCPAADWAARLGARVRAGAAVVAGHTVLPPTASHTAIASQLIADHLSNGARAPDGAVAFVPSNNLACRRAVLTGIPFDGAYRSAGGEDRDWCARVLDAGHELASEPAATVIHDPRLDLRAFLAQHFKYGRGAQRFRGTHRAAGRREPVSFYLELLRLSFRRGPRVAALIVLAQLATAAGRARERYSAKRSASGASSSTRRSTASGSSDSSITTARSTPASAKRSSSAASPGAP
jgi:glycosyltransferase involved in cell wall biosynthesis